MRPSRVLILVLIAAIVAAVAAWLLASQIKSPAEVQAETEPPAASLITAPVEFIELSDNVITSGTSRFEEPVSVTVAADGVIETAPERGADIAEGDVAMVANGRPLFVLDGDLPMWRPILPATEGSDVAQLQEALTRLGFDTGPIDGIYGPLTQAAVSDLYESRGFEALGPSEEELDGVTDASRAAADANDAVTAARQAITDLDNSILLDDGVVAATAALAQAEAARDVADAALAAAPPGTLAGELALLQQAASEAATAVNNAQNGLDAASAAASAVIAEERAQLEDAVEQAIRARTDARKALSRLREATGVTLLPSELFFIDGLPGRIDTVPVGRGDLAQGVIMTVTGQNLVINGSLPRDRWRLVSEGDEVTIENRDTGAEIAGVLGFVADEPGTNGVEGTRYYFEVEPLDANEEELDDLRNVSVRLIIPVVSSGGRVLAVPLAALSLAGDGNSIVEVEDANGETRFVDVQVGLTTEGTAEITPISGSLEEGDRVVVGR
jgi:peptidoglycan hydrolase-like protein with peptidoglycan-binding domain